MAEFHSILVCEVPLSLLKLVTLKIFKKQWFPEIAASLFFLFYKGYWGPPLGLGPSHIVENTFFVAWQNLASSIEEVVHSIEVVELGEGVSFHIRKGIPFLQGSKKSPIGATFHRTPKKPEYLIARSQLTERGPLGFGPVQFLMEREIHWLK